ncbi:class I SAM-dependent methyltransferase [Cyanobium sp. N.Huapi 1H5]|uniref:class I SAM-dependent methyltransferase n=1 Tax=Cyanobium sp. N.Huapi 1H5 TaxID=2823719 RepID=UPI0020CFB3AB|nr:class I SAM-dependent methyltransferase [Cyanobium sp. N.Huapi 1H5]MCP9837862.1 class I SAM-dependent methyltransferase [Cyanobium sp. N.Huapi 1H5]
MTDFNSQGLPISSESLSHFSSRRINTLLDAMEAPARYLEIGVETGFTFFAVSAAFKTAVDPEFLFDVPAAKAENSNSEFHQITSDEFFATRHSEENFDLVFLDGLHTWDQTYRDFCNTLLVTGSNSVIVLDDIFPSDVFSCNRDQVEGMMMRQFMTGDASNAWHGDTYKIIPLIQTFHPTLSYCTIISDGNPQSLVWRSKHPLMPPMNLIKEQGSLNMSSLDYLWFLRNQQSYNLMTEAEALALVTEALH